MDARAGTDEPSIAADVLPGLIGAAGRGVRGVAAVTLSGAGDWGARLDRALDGTAASDTVVVVLRRRRGGLLAALRLRPGGRRAPRAARVRQHLGRRGLAVVETYLLWPSASRARVAWRGGDHRARSWAQRSGLLVTGGGRLSVRGLARSRVAGPLVDALAGDLAIVAVRRRG